MKTFYIALFISLLFLLNCYSTYRRTMDELAATDTKMSIETIKEKEVDGKYAVVLAQVEKMNESLLNANFNGDLKERVNNETNEKALVYKETAK